MNFDLCLESYLWNILEPDVETTGMSARTGQEFLSVCSLVYPGLLEQCSRVAGAINRVILMSGCCHMVFITEWVYSSLVLCF